MGAGVGSIAGSLVGAGFSAYAAIQSGKMQKQMYELNSLITGKQAEYALEKGQIQEQVVRYGTKQTIGKQRASFAAQNIALDDGTALEMQKDAAKWGEVDALRVRNNAAMEAWGYRLSANSQAIQGSLAMMSTYAQAGSAIIGGISGAGQTFALMRGSSGGSGGKSGGGAGGGSSEGGGK